MFFNFYKTCRAKNGTADVASYIKLLPLKCHRSSYLAADKNTSDISQRTSLSDVNKCYLMDKPFFVNYLVTSSSIGEFCWCLCVWKDESRNSEIRFRRHFRLVVSEELFCLSVTPFCRYMKDGFERTHGQENIEMLFFDGSVSTIDKLEIPQFMQHAADSPVSHAIISSMTSCKNMWCCTATSIPSLPNIEIT